MCRSVVEMRVSTLQWTRSCLGRCATMRRAIAQRLLGAASEICSTSSAQPSHCSAGYLSHFTAVSRGLGGCSHVPSTSSASTLEQHRCLWSPSAAALMQQSTVPAVKAQGDLSPARMAASSVMLQAASSPFPPTSSKGPLTVEYPVTPNYYHDREAMVYDMAAQPVRVQSLPGSVFNVPVRVDILKRVVRFLRAQWQQGTHKTKRRSEVSGGGRKPWPQKGTGRARHGSIRSPIWKGGGVAHGQLPRSHAHNLPMAVQIMGYKCALSARAHEGRLLIMDSLVPKPSPEHGEVKTRDTKRQLERLLSSVPRRTVLLVDSGVDAADGGELLRRGARNLPEVTIMPWQQVTVYHILKHGALVMTADAAAAIAAKLQEPLAQHAAKPKRMAWWKEQQQAYQGALEELLAAEPARGQAGVKAAAASS